MEGDRPSKRNDFATSSSKNANINGKVNISDDNINRLGSSKREKINSVVILVVCVFALFFGYYQLASNINNPFSFLTNSNLAISTQVNSEQDEVIKALKLQDIDGDGLSDYDESYVYGTSVYLPDSDGDGINDGQEVKQATNPNCPEGKTCFGNGSSASTSSGVVPTFQTTPPTQSNPQINISDVRKALVRGGASQADVDDMTDQEIMEGYQQILAENPDLAGQIKSNGVVSPVVTSSSMVINNAGLDIKSVDDLKNLTGAQIKDLMIKNGAPKNLLDSISDDELKQMFIDKLNSTATSTVK